MKITTYTDELYNMHIQLYIGTWSDFLKEMKKDGLYDYIITNDNLDKIIFGPIGFHLFVPEMSRAIMFVTQKKNGIDLRTFSHELNHICLDIFNRINIKVNADNSEAYCYYYDFIFSKFIK